MGLMSKRLKGLRVWVPRPSGAICKKIVAQGGGAHHRPVMRTASIPCDFPWVDALLGPNAVDGIIFLSQYAVLHALRLCSEHVLQETSVRIAAIGPTTASVLTKHGIVVDAQPTLNYNSEGLLALSVFQSVGGLRIIIVGGRDRRPLLCRVLTDRGAAIDEWSIYRRRRSRITDRQWSALLQDEPNAVLITSMDVFYAVITLIDRYKGWQMLSHMMWLAGSPRIAGVIRETMMRGTIQDIQLVVARQPLAHTLLDTLADANEMRNR